MWSGTPLFPEARVDDGRPRGRAVFLPARRRRSFFSLLIAGLIVFYAVKYRRRVARQRRRAHPRRPGARDHLDGRSRSLITMVIFVWGASVFFAMSRPPDETLNIYVVGKQWMWKFQHLDGQREINELHVPVGRAGEADHDVRGRHPRLLRPGVPREGRRGAGPLHARSGSSRPSRARYHLFCAEYCGTQPLGDDRRGRRDGAERVPDVAERRRAGRIAGVGRRRSCSPTSRATPAIAPTRRAAARCSRACSARPVHAAERRDA